MAAPVASKVTRPRGAHPPSLPDGLLARPASSDDLEAVAALCLRCDLADLGTPDTEADDILSSWRRPGFDLPRDTVIVQAGGEVVGYGDVFEGREAFGYVDPAWRGRGSAPGCFAGSRTWPGAARRSGAGTTAASR
jgi:hypothetical protein